MTLGDLPEDELRERLVRPLRSTREPVLGIGDDCAAVRAGRDELLLLKTDALVENIHFLRSQPAARIGWKALCRPLSDIAAMGGTPRDALVTFASPRDVEVRWWEAFYRGLSKAAVQFGVDIVGGESSAAESTIFVSVALTGVVARNRMVTRSGGRPGDVLFVTGRLGGSLAGHHLSFVPRLAEAAWLVREARVRAMMDLSDGLGADLPRLAESSGVGYRVDLESLPLRRGVTTGQALGDGEDYELLMALSPGDAESLPPKWNQVFPKVPLTRIGVLTDPGRGKVLPTGGYDHFSGCQRPENPSL